MTYFNGTGKMYQDCIQNKTWQISKSLSFSIYYSVWANVINDKIAEQR